MQSLLESFLEVVPNTQDRMEQVAADTWFDETAQNRLQYLYLEPDRKPRLSIPTFVAKFYWSWRRLQSACYDTENTVAPMLMRRHDKNNTTMLRVLALESL